MMKIETRQDVKDLIDFMVGEDIQVQIYDDIFANQLISFEYYGAKHYAVKWEDTVNGLGGEEVMTADELKDKIWRNRDFINRTKQLDRIYNKIMKE